MSQISNDESTTEVAFTCNFCGSQTTDANRCTGCGATSSSRLDKPLTPAQNTLVRQGVKAQQNMNTIAVVLALGLLVVTWTICSPILLGDNTTKPGSGNMGAGNQSSVNQDLRIVSQDQTQQEVRLVLDPKLMLEMKPLEVVETPAPSMSVHSLFKSRPLEYQRANNTWGDTFNPSGNVPEKGFAAYYFNTAAPGRLVHSETVTSPGILYADDFHGISPADFGGYWVGEFELEKTRLVELVIKHNRSNARIVIDGSIVYERKIKSDANRKTILRLAKGKHLIEMEYMNKWHNSADFSVGLKTYSGELSRTNIKKLLANSIPESYDFHYVGIRKSNNTDESVKLNIQNSDKKIVLVLSSYNQVNWYLSNPHKTNIAAIVYGSAQQQSTVMGDVDPSIIMLKANSRIGNYTSPPDCVCISSGPICPPSRDFVDTKRKVEGLGYGKITGMSNRETASAIKVPQRVMTPGLFEVELKHHAKSQDRAAKECRRKNPGIEDLFSER